MRPSPSAETSGPFFPNFRRRTFLPMWAPFLRCSGLVNGAILSQKSERQDSFGTGGPDLIGK
jgi:hypothetical protein